MHIWLALKGKMHAICILEEAGEHKTKKHHALWKRLKDQLHIPITDLSHDVEILMNAMTFFLAMRDLAAQE